MTLSLFSVFAVTGRYVGQGSGPGDPWHWLGLGLMVALVLGLMLRGYLQQRRRR